MSSFMKTVRHPSLGLILLVALVLGVGTALRAEDPAPAAPSAPAAPAAADKSEKPAPAPAATTSEAPNEKGAAAETPERSSAEAEHAKPAASDASDESEDEKPVPSKKSRHHASAHSSDRERVNVGSDTRLAEGEQAEVVVSVFGSSTSAGTVDDTVVSILGSSRVTGGTVGDAVVTILGDTYVNGHVRGGVVTILGDVEFGPNAVVDGEIVSVGGEVKRDAGAVLRGNIQTIGIRGITTWFKECALKGRLLAFDFRVWWAWCIALAFLAFYFLLALVVPSAVTKCAETLEQRAGSSVITAVLVLILTPVAYLLLVFTVALGIGVALIPLFSLGLFVASLFGKVTMLTWVGRRFTKALGDSPLAHPALGVLIGGAIMLGLYTVPIVGFVTYKLLGILGLGVVVYTLILQFQAAKAARPAPAPKPAPAVAVLPSVGGEGVPPVVVPPVASAAPPVISAATLPRVGFWLRLCASFLDFILVAIVVEMLSKVLHGWFIPGGSMPFWFAVYCVVMWASKGTTIGGIICGLKVVRLDDRPIDWGVASVRALGGFLSLAVAGLGFVWVSFDDERQSWHDKIAGTTIVKVPKGTPLM
jgi:uncharacterized RDD family membrane protein YckC